MNKLLLIKDIIGKKTSRGDDYVEFVLSDGKKEGNVKMWNASKEAYANYIGKVMDFSLNESSYNGQVQYLAVQVNIPPCEYDISDFVATPPENADYMFNYMFAKANSFNNETLKYIVINILLDNEENYKKWSAAKACHHNLRSGLIYHSFRMLKVAECLSEVYEGVDSELLCAGCILHDIGKLEELETDEMGTATYTVNGKLFGHLYLGMRKIEKVYNSLIIERDEEAFRNLTHLLAAHHGKLEWGAISVPKTLEAELLHHCDMIDSRVYMYEDAYENTEKGEFSDKIFGLGTEVYHR